MRAFKLILKEIKQEDKWGVENKDAVKLGEIAFDFKGKLDDEVVEFKKGEQIYYQYGNPATLDSEEYVLVNLSSLVWQK